MARVASAGVETQGLRDLVRGRVVTLRQCEQAAQCGGERGDDEGARVDRLGRHEARGRRTRAWSVGRLRRPAADAIAFRPPPQLLVGAHIGDAERGQIGQRLEELEVVRRERLGRRASGPQETDLGAALSSQHTRGRFREVGTERGEEVGALETGGLLESAPHAHQHALRLGADDHRGRPGSQELGRRLGHQVQGWLQKRPPVASAICRSATVWSST